MKASELRKAFTQFFVEHEHRAVPSAPLVPPDDPTLLFTTAGMVQFKPLYAGAVDLPYRRATTVQKCLRAGGKGSDLENVGRTLRHHTFFEMLGNFSFGDYFKHEALHWAWEFSTKVVGLDPSRLYASVYLDDNEAWDIWTKEIGLPEARMVRLGAKDNFWGPAGDVGACGPCSEIYYDRGEKYGPGLTFQYATENDDDPNTRYIEYWNCVFPQFDQQKDGSRLPLKNRGVDTGMGLERLACITQDAASPFETDLFTPLVDAVCAIVGIKSYKESPLEIRQGVNVVADHVRALTFALSEGILPSNEGRGYVLRRLLRRAARYSRRLGYEKPFMHQLVDPVLEVMGGTYPELLETPEILRKVIRLEEEAFAQTVGAGLQRLDQLFARASGNVLSGEEVFQLGATYGLPLDDVKEIVEDRGLQINMEEYQAHLARHREESRKGAKGAKFEGIYEELRGHSKEHGKTEFLGYRDPGREYPVLRAQGLSVLKIFKDSEAISRARTGENVAILLDRTPFYAESGGQAGDMGTLKTEHAKVRVTDVQKTAEEVFVHYGVVETGELREYDTAEAEIDSERHWAIMRNHTATHLLQGALKTVIGKHVTQQGSYVGPEYLRFDFTNPEAVSASQIAEIEARVNAQIMRNIRVTTQVLSLEDARKTGAIAPFGEKYGQVVRVVDIPDWDVEFCGGTHMESTGGIGPFVILAESAIASGVRRIEAATGERALEIIQQERTLLKSLGEGLSVPREKIAERVAALQDEMKNLRKQMNQLRAKNSAGAAGEMLERAAEIEGITVVAEVIEDAEPSQLREVFDALKSRQQQNLFVALGAATEGRVTLLCAATPDAAAKVSAGDVVKKLAPIVGGSGGGRKEMAQAGGKNPEKLDDAIRAAVDVVREAMKAK